MDLLIQGSIIPLYSKLKAKRLYNSTRGNFSYARVTVWTSQFLYERWTKNLCSVENLDMEIRTEILFLVLQSLQAKCNTKWCC